MIGVSEGNIKTMIVIAIYTGFRLSEVHNLQWKDVDFDANTISVNLKHNFTPKTYEFRTIPLNQELKEYLLSTQPNNAIGKDYICKNNNSLFKTRIRKVFRAAKVKDASFLALRHAFASWLVISGISIYAVSQLLGHKTLQQQ